jgi:hypothetical protein
MSNIFLVCNFNERGDTNSNRKMPCIELFHPEVNFKLLRAKNDPMSSFSEFDDWKEAFLLFDKDKDGILSKEEFASSIRAVGERSLKLSTTLEYFVSNINFNSYLLIKVSVQQKRS